MDRRVANEHETGAMRSSIGWALLGLVIERPSYGYELVQRFERTYQDLLTLSSSARIYTGLETLSIRGLIEETVAGEREPSPVREPKPHYRATDEGKRAYEQWLVDQIKEERKRSQMFARQLTMLEPEYALEVIERYEVESLSGPDPSVASETREPSPASQVAQRLAQEDERLALGVRLSWMEYARQELTAMIDERANGT